MFTVKEKLRDLLGRRIIRYVRVFEYGTDNLIEEGRAGIISDKTLNEVYLSYQVRLAMHGYWFNVDFWI